MNSDSANPNINFDCTSPSEEVQDNPILPDAEVDSVLLYLRSNNATMRVHQPPSNIPENPVENPDIINQTTNISNINGNMDSPRKVDINATNTTEDVNKNETTSTQDGNANQTIISESEADNGNNPFLDIELGDLPPLPNPNPNPKLQVHFKRGDGKLLLTLPTVSQLSSSEANLSEIWQQLKLRLNASARLQSANTPVYLVAGNRLLDVRHLQELGEILGEHQMQLKSVSTSRRQTAIAAATAGYSVEQVQVAPILRKPQSDHNSPADALYLEMTVRSGIEIRHPGSVIILGDVNPGGNVVADGDILVWGRLRGISHAGAGGNRQCLIMALQMEPTQLRIADVVARSPEKSLTQFYPEVAFITQEGIRITKTTYFSRPQLSNLNLSGSE